MSSTDFFEVNFGGAAADVDVAARVADSTRSATVTSLNEFALCIPSGK
jgi:hypothetical protein